MLKCFLLVIVISISFFGFISLNSTVYAEDFTTVEYCELISNPNKYDKKKIRVEANYRYGYEWSELLCPDCFNPEKRTWIDFEQLDDSCSSKKLLKKFKKESPKGRTLSVIFAGTFETSSKRGYGSTNDYHFKLDVVCIEKAQVLFEDSALPDILSRKQ
jgi:hypothetical protein